MNLHHRSLPSGVARIFRGVALFLGLIGLVSAAAAQTAGNGTITGTVRNAGNDAFLEGVEVRLLNTTLSVYTERDGSFTLSHVPAGAYEIGLFYTGFERKKTDVSVTDGQTARMTLTLSPSVYKLEAYTVSDVRDGNAAAIMRQKDAANVMNAASMDAYGDVADGNIGSFLQNLPGLAVMKEAGDIVGVQVRGMPPELSNLSVDGTRSAAAIAGFTPQGDRSGLIDQIPAEFIKEVQVSKSNTPDQSADSMGGTVNLITKSAFDFSGRVITYHAGFYRNVYRKNFDQYGPSAAFSYMDTFGKNRQFAVTVSSSYTKTPNIRDIVQLNAYDANNYINARAREYNDQNTRVRAGVTSKFEYRPDRDLHLGLILEENYYASDNDRIDWDIKTLGKDRVADYSIVSRAKIEAGSTPKNTANQTAGIAPGYDDNYSEMVNPTITNKAEKEVKRSHQYKIGVTAEKTWNDSSLDFSASFNPSSYDNNFWGFIAQERAGVPVGIGVNIVPHVPVFTQTYGPTIGVGANYDLYNGSRFEQPDITREEIGDLKADYTRNFSVLAQPIVFKTGYELRNQHRWLINTYRPTWNYGGADGIAGPNAAGVDDDNLKQFLFPSSFNYGLFNNSSHLLTRDTFSRQLVDNSFHANPSYWIPSGTTVSFHGTPSIISEDVPAYYGQFNFKLGRLNVLTGVRYEDTRVRATGTFSDTTSPTQNTITVARSYHFWFPSVHLRYALTNNLLLRGAISTSSARPSFSDMIPNTSISYYADGTGLGEVNMNNPGLKADYVRNYDLSAEYYFEPAGVLSVGVFHKDISNFIYSIHELIPDGANNGFGGKYAGYDLYTTGNVGAAQVEGLEANYTEQFRFLPKPFNGLSGFVSYTGIWTEGTFANGQSALPGFVPRTWNIGGVYTSRHFEARVTYHFKSSYLEEGGRDPLPENESVVQTDPTVDATLKVKINSALEFYLDGVNILNKTAETTTNVAPRHRNKVGTYGVHLSFGMSGRF